MMATATSAAGIRYACRCGHWAPVGSMFYSEMCQKLVCRQPTCSVEEFESYYCSYLLTNMASKEASMYQNRSSRCFACVSCENVLSTVFDDAQRKYFFACSHCHWDSLDIALLDDDPDTLLMTAVERERVNPHEDIFHTLLSYHMSAAAAATTTTTTTAASAKTRSYRGFSSAAAAASSSRTSSLQSLAGSMKELQRDQQMKKFRMQRMGQMGTWKYEHVLTHVHEREQWLDAQRREHEFPELKKSLAQCASPDQSVGSYADVDAFAAHSGSVDSIAPLSQRLLNPLDQPRDAKDLFPHRPLLRVKRTWRCIESIERGSAGILVKPQISPMSGDSSLNVPGAWFKKANLAVHFLPVVTFQVLPHAAGGDPRFAECVLLIENPLDDAVQIVCQRGDQVTHHAKVLLEDATPIVVGAYEDPTLVDAFAGDSSSADAVDAATSSSRGRNQHLVSTVRNLAKLRVPVERSPLDPQQITFRLQFETLKLDQVDHEPAMETLFTFMVELTSPLDRFPLL